MERAACNIIYLDRRAREDAVRSQSASTPSAQGPSSPIDIADYFKTGSGQHESEIQTSLESILSTFSTVHICHSGGSCLSKLAELQNSGKGNTPTIVLIDVPYDEERRLKRLSREPRSTSPNSLQSKRRATTESIEPNDIYGMHLLTHIASEIKIKKISQLIVPIVVLSGFERDWASSGLPSPSVHGSQVLSDTVRLTRYLDAGAADVLTSPLSKDNAQGLAVHAYRVSKQFSSNDAAFLKNGNRRLSWVGVEEAKPYAYLREAMVSSLMGGICNPESALGDVVDTEELDIPTERQTAVAQAIGSWSFGAHDFTDDELLYGGLLMLQHVLDMPELEKFRIGTDELIRFLQVCRAAYNDFVLYHNFRHVIDVLQGVFYFLFQIGTIPYFPKETSRPATSKPAAIANILSPVDALTLIVSAIGHDVGHPGVNNAFLVALNAPLAQLYNDRSVLESFHCAAYSQILRRYWTSTFEDVAMRRLMITTILATDMGLHFKYMADLGNLQEKLDHDEGVVDLWNAKERDEYRDLICGLLIKCADISNVARVFPVAAEWARILTEEFSQQGVMEEELDIPTCLFGGPPVQDDIIKLAESQQGFMNIFARPLFECVTDVLPALQFTVDELDRNKNTWQDKIVTEREKQNCNCGRLGACRCSVEGTKRGNGSPKSTQGRTLEGSKSSEPIDSPRQDSDILGSTATATSMSSGSVSRKGSRGRSLSREESVTPTNMNGISAPATLVHEKARTKTSSAAGQTSTTSQRAVSAHHHLTKHHKDHDEMPNGVLNTGFAASETDVRYLGDSNSKVFLQENGNGEVCEGSLDSQQNSRKGKRFAGSIKRMWKKRWRNTSTQNHAVSAPGGLESPPPNVSGRVGGS